ncbi:MAG: DUF1425 domain-containing protein [Phycisphaerales bacterium]
MNRQQLLVLIPAFALAALAPIGCQQQHVAPAGAERDPLPVELYPDIVVDRGLEHVIVSDVDRIVWRAGSAGQPARLAVPIRSLSDYDVHTQYRILWYDDTGVEIGATQWRFTTLAPQVEQQFQGNSTSAKAQAWRMEIRVAR